MANAAGIAWLRNHAALLATRLESLTAERDKLAKFKAWVHAYLDDHGIPSHPPGTHGAEACRIGDRMDFVFAERDKLKTAIQSHHDQKADDRCWMDDDALYEAAGLSLGDRSVGDKPAMLRNCERFIDARCAGGKWPTYAELEAKIEELTVQA